MFLFSDPLSRHYNCDPVLTVVNTKGGSLKAICGMTILDAELFVTNHFTSDIEVYCYCSTKFSFSHMLNLKELSDPHNLGSSSQNKSLYIMFRNSVGESVMRVNRNGELLCKWKLEQFYCQMSVTDESNVLVTLFDNHELAEYSPDGNLMRKIKLLHGIFPIHAIKLKNDRFLVSAYLENRGVFIVDANGTVEKSFGGISLTDPLMSPLTYLAITGDGHVMVVDQRNRNVWLLDSSLTLVRKYRLNVFRVLRMILLDEPNRRLLVADNSYNSKQPGFGNGRILILDFQKGVQ